MAVHAVVQNVGSGFPSDFHWLSMAYHSKGHHSQLLSPKEHVYCTVNLCIWRCDHVDTVPRTKYMRPWASIQMM